MPEAPTALTIGNFDGVHIGHAALVRRARALVNQPGPGRVVALAFDPSPLTILRPQAILTRLTSFERRAQLLRDAGADEVIRLTPTAELLSKTPEQFVRDLVTQYQPRFIVEGDDFRFGKGRAGDIQTLSDLGLSLGFTTDIVRPIDVGLSDDLVVRASSSIVRWLITEGRVRDAALVLGRPYEVPGQVARGDQRGRQIGFPTANLATDHLLPADGVYAATAHLPGGQLLGAAVNVGTRPTFDGVGRRLEAHLMPMPGTDLPVADALAPLPEYDWPLSLRLIAWLRDDLRFESIDTLVAQIRRDCDHVNRVLAAQCNYKPALCAAT